MPDETQGGDAIVGRGLSRSQLELNQKLMRLERFKAKKAGEYGWVDLVLGMPEGPIMDKLMGRIKEQAAVETDVIRNMEVVGVDIFSNLETDTIGRNVKFRVTKNQEPGMEDYGGWASAFEREAVVYAPKGIDRREYLNWAVNGDIN